MGEQGKRVDEHVVCFVSLVFIYSSSLTRPRSDPRDYLKHVMKSTNMSCLTPEGAMSGDCDFLSANLYARSLFGGVFFLVVGSSTRMSYIAIPQARMLWPISASRKRRLGLSATFASGAKRKASLCRWATVLRCVSILCIGLFDIGLMVMYS